MLNQHKNISQRNNDHIDALTIFLADVAQIPTINGRHDYIPLTRRIERARPLLDLRGRDGGFIFRALKKEWETNYRLLKRAGFTTPALARFVDTSSEQVEDFLDSPQLSIPPAVEILMRSVDLTNDEDRQESIKLAWRSFYLLSLLPSELVSHATQPDNLDDFITHCETVLEAYDSAKETLLLGTMRFPIRFATYYIGRELPYLDIVQEGLIGLHSAMDKFEEAAGAHFQSYAATWIRQRIERTLIDTGHTIRVPVHAYETVRKIQQTIEKLHEKAGTMPPLHDVFVAQGWLDIEDITVLQQFPDYTQRQATQDKLKQARKRVKALPIIDDNPDNKQHPEAAWLNTVYNRLEKRLGHQPDELTLFHAMGWLTDTEAILLTEINNPDSKYNKALSGLRKAHAEYGKYRIMNAEHISWENSPTVSLEGVSYGTIPTLLVDPEDDTETITIQRMINYYFDLILSKQSDRDRKIIDLRFGLSDGDEHTLVLSHDGHEA